MRKVKDAIDLTSGERVYFKGHAKATYMSDGRTIEDAINEIGNGGGITTETDPIFANSPASTITNENIQEWNSKQDKITLEVLHNGNITITANGVSNTFMPATPSGDPMHDVYVNVGAEYNGTGEDIVRTSIYGDKIVWKNAHWWLNDLGDITNDEMRDIYLHANITQAAKFSTNMMQGIRTRTNIATWNNLDHGSIKDSQLFGYVYTIKTALLKQANYYYLSNNASWMFVSCTSLEKIFPILIATNTTSFNGALDSCKSLKEIRLEQLGANCSFKSSNLLSNASILYMIQKSNSAKTTTITLHADAYNRAMADDEIVAALSSHTNVTLAKA